MLIFKKIHLNSFKNFLRSGFLIVATLSCCSYGFSQIPALPGSIDATFSSGSGPHFYQGMVYATVVQTDGSVIIGGSFSQVNKVPANYLARLKKDGTVDTEFCANFTKVVNDTTNPLPISSQSPVTTLALQPNGQILVGYPFYGTAGGLIRINSNGTLDKGFNNNGGGFTGSIALGYAKVSGILVQPDGKILVVGIFNGYNNTTISQNIARLLPDGSLDPNFKTGLGFNGAASSIGLQSNGDIIVGGSFDNYNSTSNLKGIVRLKSTDGSYDPSFQPDISLDSDAQEYIAALLVQHGNDDAIIYTKTGYGNYRSTLQRIDKNGKNDASFVSINSDSSNPHNANEIITSLLQINDTELLIGGQFTQYDNQAIPYFALVSLTNGNFISGFNGGGSGFNAAVASLSLAPSGQIFVGGQFNSLNNTNNNSQNHGIVELNAKDGSPDSSFNNNAFGTGLDDSDVGIFSAVEQPDGKIVIGGLFNNFNDIQVSENIARLNSDGSVDKTFNGGKGFSAYGDAQRDAENSNVSAVKSLALQNANQILAGGSFALPFTGLTRLNLDGSLDSSFTFLSNAQFTYATSVTDFKIQPGTGDIVASFYSNPGIVFTKATDGLLDPSKNVGNGFDPSQYGAALYCVQPQDDGSILVGGTFTSFNGFNNASVFSRLKADGSLDSTFNNNHGNGPNPDFNCVTSIYITPLKNILVAYENFNSSPETSCGVKKFNKQGNLIKEFAIPDGTFDYYSTISNLTVINDVIFVGSNVQTGNSLISLNLDGTPNSTIAKGANGFNGTVNKVIASQFKNNSMLVVGQFTKYGTTTANSIVRLVAPPALPSVSVTAVTSTASISTGSVSSLYSLSRDSVPETTPSLTSQNLGGYFVIKRHSKSDISKPIKVHFELTGSAQRHQQYELVNNDDGTIANDDIVTIPAGKIKRDIHILNLSSDASGKTVKLLIKKGAEYNIDEALDKGKVILP